MPEKQEQQCSTAFYTTPLQQRSSNISLSSTIQTTKKYHLRPRLSLERREIITACRHLRRLQSAGISKELDVEKTIQQICQTGFFLSPVFRPRRRNEIQLILLIDQQGSMAPFSLLTEALIESILQSDLLEKTSLYYFPLSLQFFEVGKKRNSVYKGHIKTKLSREFAKRGKKLQT